MRRHELDADLDRRRAEIVVGLVRLRRAERDRNAPGMDRQRPSAADI
ncbi:MAG: hypothetical protein WB774_19400 [Xanthobacteraceae bacterium]